MARARRVVSLGLAARTDAHLKVRTPLRRALVLVPEGRALSDDVIEEVRDALNVRRVELITDLEGLVDYEVVPNFAKLGPRVGKLMPQVQSALKAADGAAVRSAFDETGRYRIELDGDTVDVHPDEVDVRATSHAEFALAKEGAYAVALDTALDDELRREGLARELARRLNDLRKASGFEIADRVRVTMWTEGPLADAAREHEKWIAGEVLAERWDLAGPDAPESPDVERVDVDGYRIAVQLEKIEP
jgi:isoleucyl-tRNA synthetase